MLGTGYGECKIKKFISKDYRRRGGILLDGQVLFDAPSDIFELADELGLSDIFNAVSLVFISHSHKGHFSPETLYRLSKKKKITVFASAEVLSMIEPSPMIDRVPLKPYFPIDLGALHVIPLPAPHRTENPKEQCFNFLIAGEKNLLLALDGAVMRADYLWLLPLFPLDAAIMDTAEELKPISKNILKHGSFTENCAARDLLLSLRAAGEKTRFILSHIPTDKKRSIHTELSDAAREAGFITAYDGYFFTV